MKKGISLVALIVTIIVLITLITTISITANNVYNNSKKVKFASEFIYIQELVNTYRKNNNGKIPYSKMMYIDVTNVAQEDIDEQFHDELIYNNQIILYKIDLKTLNTKELFFGNAIDEDSEDIYCFSNTTGKLYYIKGLKIGSETYYTLTDDLKESINYVENNNVNDGILFIYNNNFNNKGEIDIKIPSSYLDILLTSTDTNFTTTKSNDNKYIIYKTISNVNSVITVNYKKTEEDEIRQLKYVVSNIDKESPTFDISGIKTITNNQTGKEEKYIEIENLSDNFSGIKSIKYTNRFISEDDEKEYFTNKGTMLKDGNIITLSDDMYYITVYVEDEAGNYTVKKTELATYIKTGLILRYDGIQNTRDGNNESSTVWEDLSGKNNDGIFVNSNNNTITYKENGYEFTKNSDYIETTNKLGLATDPNITVEVVYKWYGFQDSQTLAGFFTTSNFNNTNGYSLVGYIRSDNDLAMASVNARVSAGIATTNTIRNVSFVKKTGTFNTNNLIIYNNSEKATIISSANTATMNLQDATMQIGRGWQHDEENRTLNGIIYAVRVYNRVLTEEEIKYNYEIDKARFGIK